MDYIYDCFANKSAITIFSSKPEDLNSAVDILAILLYDFPKLNPNHIIVSNPHENIAVVVGDNINLTGRVKVYLKKTPNLKGMKANAPSYWEYTIDK